MKRTYNQTYMKSNAKLQLAKIIIDLFANSKYEDAEPTTTVEYTGLTAWDMIEGGKEAEEIESEMDEDFLDENHEYLILHFNDGTQATFRNSHVDMFIR